MNLLYLLLASTCPPAGDAVRPAPDCAPAALSAALRVLQRPRPGGSPLPHPGRLLLPEPREHRLPPARAQPGPPRQVHRGKTSFSLNMGLVHRGETSSSLPEYRPSS